MPRREYDKEFFVLISATDRLRFRIDVEHGQVEAFVVQYELSIDDHWYPVVRYDSAHGQGHRDTLDQNGATVEKFWLSPVFTNKESLNYAHADLLNNWQQYRDAFLERFVT